MDEREALRVRRRAQVAMVLWTAAALFFLWVALAQVTGLDPEPDPDAALGSVLIAIPLTAMAVVSGLRMRHARAEPPPRERRPLPRATLRAEPLPGSWARRPVQRLQGAEAALHDVLDLLASRPVPPGALDGAREAAVAAAGRLRGLGHEVGVLERARLHAPAADHADLDADIAALGGRLDAGVERFAGMVAAAARVLAASARTDPEDLAETTEQLTALAGALRELTPPPS